MGRGQRSQSRRSVIFSTLNILISTCNGSIELEAVLILAGAIIPQPRPPRDEDAEDEDGLDDDDDSSVRRPAAATMTNGKPTKNIRGKSAKDDDDSDFEFDL